MYADVIINISHESVDRPFEYIIPEELEGAVKCGSCVRVPFGRNNKLREGYVINITQKASIDEARLKKLDSIVPKSTSADACLIALADFIRENYGGTMNQALKTVLPVKKSAEPVTEKYICLNVSGAELEAAAERFAKDKRMAARLRLAEALKDEAVLPERTVRDRLNISQPTLKALEAEGIIRVDVKEDLRNVVHGVPEDEYTLKLNPMQQQTADSIWHRYERGDMRPSLIHGITGSGKTEIYIDLISRFVSQGRQAIVLIPEIALTYQTVMRFYRKFRDRVSVINSKMTAAERFDQFEKARTGKIDIMIGPRSALFTPFPDLGIIIIDEEHEGTYKNEQIPRYNAVEVAAKRAELEGGITVLGSATPSVLTYFKASEGTYELYKLKSRAAGGRLPDVEIVDLRSELAAGNRSIISMRLQELIGGRLKKGEQTMLFINRRGYSSFVSCRACGTAMMCPHCDVSLKYHSGGKLMCHYCGYETPMVKTCPSCGSVYIGTFGSGTQKVENEINRLFPEARTLRMDGDTTKKKGGHEKILRAFADHEADILIGTQMIVKGHDYANVTLVGIVAADLSLYAGDYQAPERTFDLIVQAAGRAGRGELAGNVVIQTYSPENYAVNYGALQDYESFYEQEMAFRNVLGYPPALKMLGIQISGRDEKKLDSVCAGLSGLLDKKIKEKGRTVTMIGPVPPQVAKISDRYRRMIYLKSRSPGDLTYLKEVVENYINDAENKDIMTVFDFS